MSRIQLDGPSAGTIAAAFACAACGEEAETVRFLPRGVPGNHCSGDAVQFHFGSETMMLGPGDVRAVRAALTASDAAALHAAHPRWAASYCPQCRACYCRRHWTIEQEPDPAGDGYSMHYDTHGTCPSGHRRLMAKDGPGWPQGDRDAGGLIVEGK